MCLAHTVERVKR